MITRIDLNADMGENFGPWVMGADEALFGVVTSANIACGFHAGDPDTMAVAMAQAVAKGVGIGAHPGLPDLAGFGRRRMQISLGQAGNLVACQLGAAQAMARLAGGRVRHLKLHGALANMAAEDEPLARACFTAALAVDPGLILMVIAGTAQARVAATLGARVAHEVFADRAYGEDGLLLDRRMPGAVLHDPGQIADRMLAMLRAGAIITAQGTHLPTRIDTICVHGDGPTAVEIAQTLRSTIEGAGITVARFDG